MAVEIVNITPHPKGNLYTVRISEWSADILFLFHTADRMKKWGITDRMVIETLLLPEEVLVGHGGRYIAHRRYVDHLTRAVYEYQDQLPVLVTGYFPCANRYFRGGGILEDKILKRS